jgi:AsmA-like C-terminal region/AsmA family
VSPPRSKLRLWVVGGLVLLVLFLARPGASRLKNRIANSIGMALQRQVEIGSVHLRLLPRPGFDLENFVVHDDPEFGAEPVLRAQEVTAALRLTSLLHGRMEIARLSLTEPSLNLTRNQDGHWNLENLLERAAKTAIAPTAKARSESRPGFPYIEADRGRINFKFGPEKKAFALTEADYALWQDSENAWAVRLKAKPTRTDFSVSDTGQLKIEGSWQRAATLRETPVQFNLVWDGAQLGQATKLFSGQDRGWRGTITLSADLAGTPGNLAVQSDAWLADFRRYDILGGGTLALHTHCDARYSSADRGLHQIACQTPVGDGVMGVQGEIANVSGPRHYEFELGANQVPAESLLRLVRHMKKNLPDDLLAGGTVAAEFKLRAGTDVPNFLEVTGSGSSAGLRLRSQATKTELVAGDVPFSLTTASTRSPKRLPRRSQPNTVEPPQLTFGPFPLRLGRATPTTIQASITRSGYSISVNGEADLQRLLQTARTIGVPARYSAAEGWTRLALQITGEWSGFASPTTAGNAQLRGVRADVAGLNEPIEIGAANVKLGANDVKVDGISASLADMRWTGSISLPRPCVTVQSCPVSFDLHANEIATDELNDLFHPPKKRWYGFLSSRAPTGPWFVSLAHGSGTVSADRFWVRDLAATHVTAKVDFDEGLVRIDDLSGEIAGGKHRGEWRADFRVAPPRYSGAGAFDSVSLARLAEMMHDGWISGTASARYKIEIDGRSAAELAQSANGTIDFNMRDGELAHVALTSGPLKVRRFTGILAIHDGEVEMQDGALDSSAATFTVSGRASLSRELDFQLLQGGSPGIRITGTIAEPRVLLVQHPETRAALKP